MKWRDKLSNASLSLLYLLLLCTTCLGFYRSASAASWADGLYTTPMASYTLVNGACSSPQINLTNTNWYDFFAANAPQAIVNELDLYYPTHSIATFFSDGPNTELHIELTDPQAASAPAIEFDQTQNIIFVNNSSQELIAYVDSSCTVSFISHSAGNPVIHSADQLYQLVSYPEQTTVTYPEGYEGVCLTSVACGPTTPGTQTFPEMLQDTAALVLSNSEMAVFGGLFLGAINFVAGWLVATLFTEKWGKHD